LLEQLDYVSIGGVFSTRSKDNPDPPIGLEGLAGIAASVRARRPLPLCAIAGIDTGNLDRVLQAGVDGVALISAITRAPDPALAARELRARIDQRRTA
ncbi:MAG: thiamine phosphate synthase, partial [Candidatus Competibacterales bacterium]|nr:thiamine phosphate synthase [Candidatus Competibacterales bacterium]